MASDLAATQASNTQRGLGPGARGLSVLGKRDQGLAKTSPPRADVISHSKPLLKAAAA